MSDKILLSLLETKRENNFNLLRFIAALMVILFHNLMFLDINIFLVEKENVGTLAVNMFFITSGFLVSRSLLHNPSLLYYYLSRLLRIWPALILNAIIISFIIAPILAVSLDQNYLYAAIDYVYANLTLYAPNIYTLPGVLENTHYSVVNSPLWTLGYEVFFYCLLALISQTLLFKKRRVFIVFLAIILLLNITVLTLELQCNAFTYNILRFAPLFFLGVGFQLFKDKIWLSYERLLLCLGLFIITIFLQKQGLPLAILNYVLLSYIIITIAYLPKGTLLKFNELGDYSYGLYIYGWPIGIGLSLFIKSYVLLTLLTISLTLIFALLSWHYVEKNCLSFKKRIPKIENTTKSSGFYPTLALLFLFAFPLVNQPPWHLIKGKRVTYMHPYVISP